MIQNYFINKYMAANLNHNRLVVERMGHPFEIPNKEIPKLMYYLNCINDLIPNFILSSKYLDYRKY